MAETWWDESGEMAPLHAMNPARMGWIHTQIQNHDPAAKTVLDVGCGAGLVSEPLARLGYDVTGIDMGEPLIAAAKAHAKQSRLSIDYTLQDIHSYDADFDVVLVLEVLEHVDDPAAFLNACAARVKPGGLLIASTLNRTAKSFALAIIGAEYILRWLPTGTHQWKKFIKPSEMAAWMRMAELMPQQVNGLVYNPINRQFSMHERDVDVNYFMAATKPL